MVGHLLICEPLNLKLSHNRDGSYILSLKENRLEMSEWVAVFYPHKFYVGRVVEMTKDDSPSIQFLDRRPGETFILRKDTEIVTKNWIFCRKLEVSLVGKKQYFVANYATIESEYDAFKKRYTLKEKVRSSSDVYKFINFYYYVLLITSIFLGFCLFVLPLWLHGLKSR